MKIKTVKILVISMLIGATLYFLIDKAMQSPLPQSEINLPKAQALKPIDFWLKYKSCKIYQKENGDYFIKGTTISHNDLLPFIESSRSKFLGKRSIILCDQDTPISKVFNTIQTLAKTGFDHRIIFAAFNDSKTLTGYTLKLPTLEFEPNSGYDRSLVENLKPNEISIQAGQILESKKNKLAASLIIGIREQDYSNHSKVKNWESDTLNLLISSKQKYPCLSVYLLPDSNAKYQKMIDVLDACEKAGTQDVFILHTLLDI